ncbi:TolC family protein [Desulfomarina sp.]
MNRKKIHTLLRLLFSLAVLLLSCLTVPGFSLTLDECVQLALKNNPDLQKEQLSLNIAREELTDQRAKGFGRLDLVGSYTHFNLPRTLAPLTPSTVASGGTIVPTTQDLLGAGVIYEVALFTGFAQLRAVEIAELRKETARAARSLSREQLIYNVKALFLSSLSLQAQDSSLVAYIRALQKLYDNITVELSLGKKARIDQLKAATSLKKAKADRKQLTARIEISNGSLADLAGVEQLQTLEKMNITPESIIAVHENFVERLTKLKRLQAARLTAETNEKIVEKSTASLLPQVLFNASYMQNFGPNDSTNKYSGDWNNQEIWQLGLNLKWNIFDFGSTRSKIEKSRILARQSRYEQRKIELALKQSILEAIARINMAVTDYNSTREELQLIEETEKIEQVRFDQGTIDISDLLYTKARHQQTLSRFLAAGYTYTSARFYLDYLLERGESIAFETDRVNSSNFITTGAPVNKRFSK